MGLCNTYFLLFGTYLFLIKVDSAKYVIIVVFDALLSFVVNHQWVVVLRLEFALFSFTIKTVLGIEYNIVSVAPVIEFISYLLNVDILVIFVNLRFFCLL